MLLPCIAVMLIGCHPQEEWSLKQQQREVELTKLTERVQKLREERQRLSEEVKRLREQNYSLMADINGLHQEKSAALLANKDLQIQVCDL